MKLSVEHISKSFSSYRQTSFVLSNVSFCVSEGQFVSLLGPSGCGKTTMMSIIAGFQKAQQGVIKIDERVVSSPGPDRGVVFQNYALFPWMTVGDNIRFPMKQQKMPRLHREELLASLLNLANLTGKEGLYPHQLSGGMKQRTAVVRALASKPQVLLMDEPLAAVDIQMRQQLQEELEAMFIKNRTTLVMVTHDIEEAVYMSDRVLVMSNHQGHIVEDICLDLPRPRERLSEQYREYVVRVMSALKAASGQAEPNLHSALADIKTRLSMMTATH